jgi:hypothetical protein
MLQKNRSVSTNEEYRKHVFGLLNTVLTEDDVGAISVSEYSDFVLVYVPINFDRIISASDLRKLVTLEEFEGVAQNERTQLIFRLRIKNDGVAAEVKKGRFKFFEK